MSDRKSSLKNSPTHKKKPCCFSYLFNLCRVSTVDSLEISDFSDIHPEPDPSKTLVTQHYSLQFSKTKSFSKGMPCLNGLKYSFLMCPELTIYTNMHIMLTFHSNMFLLNNNGAGIVARISIKTIKLTRSFSENFSFENSYMKFNWKSLEKNQKSAKSSANEVPQSGRRSKQILQETISSLAKRLNGQAPVILDASGNEGSSAIAWAREGINVVIVEENLVKLNRMRSSFMNFADKNRIDFVYGKLEEIKQLYSNFVFLQLDKSYFCDENEMNTSFLVKNLKEKIEKCLKIAENLVILLPKNCNLNEIAGIFKELCEENYISPVNFCLQIEMIYVNNLLDSYVVLFGDLFNIKKDEENDLFISMIFQENSYGEIFEMKELFREIIHKLGGFKTTQTLASLYTKLGAFTKEILQKEVENLPLNFLQEASNLGYLKEKKKDEYLSKFRSLYFLPSPTQIQNIKDSFSFNPLKNKIQQQESSPLEWNTPSISGLQPKTQNEMNLKRGIEMNENDGKMYSPSSYSDFMNSHQSSLKWKSKDDEEFNNLVIVENEFP